MSNCGYYPGPPLFRMNKMTAKGNSESLNFIQGNALKIFGTNSHRWLIKQNGVKSCCSDNIKCELTPTNKMLEKTSLIFDKSDINQTLQDKLMLSRTLTERETYHKENSNYTLLLS